jgi:hypothetical protein
MKKLIDPTKPRDIEHVMRGAGVFWVLENEGTTVGLVLHVPTDFYFPFLGHPNSPISSYRVHVCRLSYIRVIRNFVG